MEPSCQIDVETALLPMEEPLLYIVWDTSTALSPVVMREIQLQSSTLVPTMTELSWIACC
jgi:hypothetical protein